MPKLTSQTWLAIAVVLVIIIFAVLYNTAWKQPGAAVVLPSATSSAPIATTPAPAKTTSPATGRTIAKQPAISVLSPAKGDKWAINVSHTIRWSSPASATGQIYLVSASTGITVGWINPGTGANQTYFDWSADSVALSRTSGVRKDITVGDYIIKIKFDNNTPEISSGVFSIVYPSEIKVPVYNAAIKNFVVTPSSVSVKKGDQVLITNNDPVSLVISVVGRSGMTIQSGQSQVFDTANLSSGQYYLYSEQYPSLKLTVNVQ